MSQSPFIAFDPVYAHPLPEGHRFPMLKYELIPEQLRYEGTITEGHIFKPGKAADEDILRIHSHDYWMRMKRLVLSDREMRVIGFPLSAGLIEREQRITQGSIDCALQAAQGRVALNVAGGTHHALADRGEGFCLLNDFAIAAAYLLHHGLAQKVLIVDLDVHQGNGTAKIFETDSRVFTFSMHGGHNYPFHKEKSDLDLPLADGTTGAVYRSLLATHLPVLLDTENPDVVFYLAGADVLDTDKYGKLQLTIGDCRMRDEFVFSECRTRGLGVAVSMGGGYSADVRRIVEAHCNTFRAANEIYEIA